MAGWSNGHIHHSGMKWESEVGNRDKQMNFTIFAEPDKFNPTELDNICTHISTLFELDNIIFTDLFKILYIRI